MPGRSLEILAGCQCWKESLFVAPESKINLISRSNFILDIIATVSFLNRIHSFAVNFLATINCNAFTTVAVGE